MDCYNTESDNIENLVVRPLKKAKCSESSDFQQDKLSNDCTPPSSPASTTILKMDSDHTDDPSNEENFNYQSLNKANCSELNGSTSSSPPSTTILASPKMEYDHVGHPSIVEILDVESFSKSNCSELSDDLDKLMSDKSALLNDGNQHDEHEQFKENQTYDYLPQDYNMIDLDCCAQIAIETSLSTDILVKIDDISVNQEQLSCLLDPTIFLNDDVISAYICCMKVQSHLQNRNGVRVYFENPFYSRLLKRDGEIEVNENGNFVTKIVRKYLNHDMIFIPINIKDSHWYLAIVNAQKREIQILDSMCWKFHRTDMTTTLQGLQKHLNILERQQNLVNHNWKDLQVATWTVTEQVQEPVQKDGASCGLFMLKFMEYWTGDTLSKLITQEEIDLFRYKLAGILLNWKTNTAGMISKVEQSEVDLDDVELLESLDVQKEASDQLSVEAKYSSLMSVVSKMSVQDLIGGLCNYIKSIDCPETLEKIWVQSSKPYPISLTLKKLQGILNKDQPMDRDCFNLIIRKFMFDNIQKVKKYKGNISKHYLDLQFWMLTDFGRHPEFRKELDVERLANSVRSWPGIDYNVSTCKTILMPIEFYGAYILIILNKDTRTLYVLDPTPLNPIYKHNPNARFVKKLLWIAEYLQKAMVKACPGSRWNEDVFLWHQVILPDVPVHSRELSGYLVSLFMCAWKDEHLQLPYIQDDNELRKQAMAQVLMYEDNERKQNMPDGVRQFLNCISSATN